MLQTKNNLLAIFDEAVDIPEEFWNAAKAMCVGSKHRWQVLNSSVSTVKNLDINKNESRLDSKSF